LDDIKKENFMKNERFLIFALLLAAISVVIYACGNNSPTSSGSSNTSTPTPGGSTATNTPTPTATSTPAFNWNGEPVILAGIEAVSFTGQLSFAYVAIGTQSGPVYNAAVTLSSPSGSVTLSNGTNNKASYPVTYNGGVTQLSLGQYLDESITYTGGQAYTITVAIAGNTYTSSVTAFSVPVFTTGSTSVICTWTGGGNDDYIVAKEISGGVTTVTFGPNITSPYVISSSSLPNYSPGNYSLTADIGVNTSTFPGSAASYFFADGGAPITYWQDELAAEDGIFLFEERIGYEK
jgi:hypothetical protein